MENANLLHYIDLNYENKILMKIKFKLKFFELFLALLLSTNTYANVASTAQSFRKIFIAESQVYSESPQNSLDELDQLIFYPTSSMLENHKPDLSPDLNPVMSPTELSTPISPLDYLNRLSSMTSTLRSLHLFEEGQTHSAKMKYTSNSLLDTREITRKTLRSKPMTMVIVPGIFGEFIKTRAFEEVFEQGEGRSHFWNLWQSKLSQYESINGHKYLPSYDLNKYLMDLKRIQDLVSIASIDDTDGKPLVQVILFKTAPFSLETLGAQTERASQFNSRLSAVIEILGNETLSNLVFVGYSRGTAIGLEMLAQAKESKLSWLNKVRGMVSLGGVNFGSALADKSLPQLTELETMSIKLAPMQYASEVNDSMSLIQKTKIAGANAAVISENHKIFAKNIATYAVHGYELSPALPKVDVRNTYQNMTQISLGNIGGLIHEVSRVFDFSLETFSPYVISDFNKNVQKHNNNVTRYNGNIARFQMFVLQTIQAARELSTQARLNWWSTRTLPLNGIKYYSVAATMSEPLASPLEKDLAESRMGFRFGSPDDTGLLQNFRDLRDYSGEHLNDSQVSINRVRFWPELTASLNPNNRGMNSQFLGVVNTHHWGLALKIVTETKDGAMNPFPRSALLKAIATSVAQDISR